MNLNLSELQREFDFLLRRAIEEDQGKAGDVTSAAIFSRSGNRHRELASCSIYSRQTGVLSGMDCAIQCFRKIDSDQTIEASPIVGDGQDLWGEQEILRLHGSAMALLGAERIALNFLGFFSGIAGRTKECIAALGDSNTKILDTRKTLPGYRILSKAAVLDGGGSNHRMGLFDMVMIKDNHVDAAGGIEAAVDKVRRRWNSRYKIEVECRNLDELGMVLAKGVDIAMLDNMSREDCAAAVELRNAIAPAVKLEASGDFSVEKIKRYGDLGLDYISVGGLTHSVVNHNFSMRFHGKPILLA